MDNLYLAPGGKEYTQTAGQLAGLNKRSKILDIACGRGVASISLAKRFGCQATAVDLEDTFIAEGRKIAQQEKIENKVTFITADFNTLKLKKNSFDMIIAEGGALSFVGRHNGLQKANQLLKKNGYIEISDLILRSGSLNKNLKEIYAPGNMDLETEDSYRTMLAHHGFKIIFCSLIAQHYWDNYYENIKQNIQNRKGPFSDKDFRNALNKEIKSFYKHKASDKLGYIFIVAKKA